MAESQAKWPRNPKLTSGDFHSNGSRSSAHIRPPGGHDGL